MANELYHWGVKGMRWGVRRYQNEDGTLTEEGKKRYIQDEHGNIINTKKKQALEDYDTQQQKLEDERTKRIDEKVEEKYSELAFKKGTKDNYVQSDLYVKVLNDDFDKRLKQKDDYIIEEYVNTNKTIADARLAYQENWYIFDDYIREKYGPEIERQVDTEMLSEGKKYSKETSRLVNEILTDQKHVYSDDIKIGIISGTAVAALAAAILLKAKANRKK